MKIRLLTQSDIPAGMRLKDLAGWNQTPADWERFLRASPAGCFAAEVDGSLVGTSATIVYEDRFAWIGMVLVDPAFRRRGIGPRLLEVAIRHLDVIGVPTQKLDATPQGKPIYEKLGFVTEYELERWVLRREPAVTPALSPSGVPDLDKIIETDREVFGADRGDLLRSLHANAPDFTLAIELESGILGYALGRGGSRADHLGPWMAWDEPTARELLDEFLRRAGRDTVFVDCPKTNTMVRDLLISRRFVISRPLTRMCRGPNGHPGQPELVCAILGPEFG
ncbi:MAG: GNAT family N-acetyltransferase [Terriglobia bacterium]|jgi:GNAT superfamily N-acetyltransferase